MKKVGELYNIPIVEGDPNLLTNNHLLYKDGVLSRRASNGDIKNLGSSGSGGGEGVEPEIVYLTEANGMILELALMGGPAYLAKYRDGENIVINSIASVAANFGQGTVQVTNIIAISFFKTEVYAGDGSFIPFDEFISYMTNAGANLTEITKEEFYKLPVALTIYGPTEDDAIDYEDKMKTAFDTLWTIWERDGVDGQDLAITIPNADIASVTLINNEGTNAFNITSILGDIETTTSEITNVIRFNGQYGATLSKIENLITGEITYVYESLS